MVKTAWFKRYAEADLPESFDEVLQSWDVASTIGETRHFSVCTTWYVDTAPLPAGRVPQAAHLS